MVCESSLHRLCCCFARTIRAPSSFPPICSSPNAILSIPISSSTSTTSSRKATKRLRRNTRRFPTICSLQLSSNCFLFGFCCLIMYIVLRMGQFQSPESRAALCAEARDPSAFQAIASAFSLQRALLHLLQREGPQQSAAGLCGSVM